MSQTLQPIPLTRYNPFLDTATIIYEVPTAVRKASWLPNQGALSSNSAVTINRTGIQDVLPILERPEAVIYLQAAFSATATGLSIVAPGVANIATTAAGSNQGAATLIAADINAVTTATADQGVRLPAITPLDVITIINSTAVNIKIYPAVGDYIGTAAVNVAVDLAAGQRATFCSKSTAVANTTTAVWYRL